MKIYNSITELAGNTPLLRSRDNLGAELVYKIEAFNPAGSAKDRVAVAMLCDARERGVLAEGGTVIEPTSGNTGIGLAAYGVPMGYRVILVMPDTMSRERISLIRAYGAEVVLTEGAKGMKGAIEMAEALANEIEGAFIPAQFENPSNPDAHYRSTGREIWEDTEGAVDVFVATVGTGGTLSGTARYLKEKNPNIEIVGVEPAASPLITKGIAGAHKIQGIGANFIPKNYDASVVDRVIAVTDEDAMAEAKALVRREGIFAGISSGAASFAARALASMPEYKGKRIVALLPDSGERYISTGIFE